MTARSALRLTVRVGAARVALAGDQVAEVIRSPRISRVPNGPDGLLGVMHLRGKVLPVVSLQRLLGAEQGPAGTARVVVLDREPPLGLALDAVESLQAVEYGGVARDGQLLFDQADGARWLDLEVALGARFQAIRAPLRAPSSRTEAAPTPAASAAAAAVELAFLAFSLAGQAYGLPLAKVAEVVPLPAGLTVLPQTEEVLLGVFPLRGSVLPALSARALLGLPMGAAEEAGRAIVVRIGRHRLALVVDRVDAILRAPPDRLGPAPGLFNRGGGEARIDAVLRLEDGRGLVALLSPERLLADHRVARLLARREQDTDHDKDETMAAPSPSASRERFLLIRLGEEAYGLAIAAVDEVVRHPAALTRLPKAPAYVRGVMSLRGRMIPVIDQRRRFGIDGGDEGRGRVVVVTIGALQAGFAVDAATEILEVAPADLLPAPDMAEGGGRVFDRAARVGANGEVVLLIDPAALLSRAEADLLRDLTAPSPRP